jgi:hypothetical protein
VNASDPGGNAAVYRDGEYIGQINPGQPGYDDYFSKSGIQPSQWVDYNNSVRVANEGVVSNTGNINQNQVQSFLSSNPGTSFAGCGLSFCSFSPDATLLMSPFLYGLSQDPAVAQSIRQTFALSKKNKLEYGFYVYWDDRMMPYSGVFFKGPSLRQLNYPQAFGTVVATVHTHPFDFDPSTGDRFGFGPSDLDLEIPYQGLIVNWDATLIGYGYRGLPWYKSR